MASDEATTNDPAAAATTAAAVDQPEHSDPPTPLNTDIDEAAAIKNLAADVRDQDDLHRDITLQAAAAHREQEDKKDQVRVQKLQADKETLQAKRQVEERKLKTNLPLQKRRAQAEIDKIDAQLKQIDEDVTDFESRIQQRRAQNAAASDQQHADKGKSSKIAGESQRDFLIRTGKITPFAHLGRAKRLVAQKPQPDGELIESETEDEDEEEVAAAGQQDSEGPQSHQILRMPGFAEVSDETPDEIPSEVLNEATPTTVEAEFSLRPRKKRKVDPEAASSDEFRPASSGSEVSGISFAVDLDSEDHDAEADSRLTTRKRKGKDKAVIKPAEEKVIDLRAVDDGNEANYQLRLRDWVQRRSKARRQRMEEAAGGGSGGSVLADDGVEEWFKPAPDAPDHFFNNRLKLPGDIHPALFSYQKTGVQWLAELYGKEVGGIVGDEMGLGKTVQAIAFVAALHYSGMLKKPVIVVTPATVLRQWVDEFHRWWPPLRVSILHSSGSGLLDVKHEEEVSLERAARGHTRRRDAIRKIVGRVREHGHVLITTYTGLNTYAHELTDIEWAYAILDEGHKIRNPNASITITCKELMTPHRIILSGTPIQNNLSELWSLFDFIYPMCLGNLVEFKEKFDMPIRHGSYASATNLEILTAEKCADTLKSVISKYLLQRLKVDVAADLPEKTEQVLFCKLTDSQLKAYELFLRSEDCAAIMSGKRNQLYGIDALRKICNHPDLLDTRLKNMPNYDWGNPEKSGKMQVVEGLLRLWKQFGHKTLLFSQSKLMLNILESYLRKMGGINYFRMDGETPIQQRQILIDKFNKDPNIHIFLLTTRTGGLGVNLTGADRIIIFDPDWNPSTDMQARERAWRLGQTRPVAIYRLVTSGTIEEKIYHRQIYKQYMTDKVLKDPKQHASFNLHELFDLFSLGHAKDSKGRDERSKLFRGAEVTYDSRDEKRNRPSSASSERANGKDTENPENEAEDVQKINNVESLEAYQEEKKGEAHEEGRMMQNIFARSVDTAYEHEKIVNGKRKIQADLSIITQDANKTASDARAHLERAQKEARRNPVGSVTWTGEVGSVGKRKERVTVRTTAKNKKTEPINWKGMIERYLKSEKNPTSSKVIKRFTDYCTNDNEKSEFMQALHEVAKVDNSNGYGKGVWRLKDPKK